MNRNRRKIKSYSDLINAKRELRLEAENKEALIKADMQLLRMKMRPSRIFDKLAESVREGQASQQVKGNIIPGIINIVTAQLFSKNRKKAVFNIAKGVGSLLVLRYSGDIVTAIQSFIASQEQKA